MLFFLSSGQKGIKFEREAGAPFVAENTVVGVSGTTCGSDPSEGILT